MKKLIVIKIDNSLHKLPIFEYCRYKYGLIDIDIKNLNRFSFNIFEYVFIEEIKIGYHFFINDEEYLNKLEKERDFDIKKINSTNILRKKKISRICK